MSAGWTVFVVIIALAVGFALGVTVTIGSQVREAQRLEASEPLRPTAELLGEVTTTVPGENAEVDKILAEAERDDL
jgi:UPF0716 family protein affecting phage T7 exclusion